MRITLAVDVRTNVDGSFDKTHPCVAVYLPEDLLGSRGRTGEDAPERRPGGSASAFGHEHVLVPVTREVLEPKPNPIGSPAEQPFDPLPTRRSNDDAIRLYAIELEEASTEVPVRRGIEVTAPEFHFLDPEYDLPRFAA